MSSACELARAMESDGFSQQVVLSLATLGNSGKCPQNQERDLFKWLSGLLDLEPYDITLRLKDRVPNFLVTRVWGL